MSTSRRSVWVWAQAVVWAASRDRDLAEGLPRLHALPASARKEDYVAALRSEHAACEAAEAELKDALIRGRVTGHGYRTGRREHDEPWRPMPVSTHEWLHMGVLWGHDGMCDVGTSSAVFYEDLRFSAAEVISAFPPPAEVGEAAINPRQERLPKAAEASSDKPHSRVLLKVVIQQVMADRRRDNVRTSSQNEEIRVIQAEVMLRCGQEPARATVQKQLALWRGGK